MINFVIYEKSNKLKNSQLHLRNLMTRVPLEKQIACKFIWKVENKCWHS